VPGLNVLLDCLVPLHGSVRVADWKALADQDRWLELVERLLVEHYDPSYDRSMRLNFGLLDAAAVVRLEDTDETSLARAADTLRSVAAQR